MQRMIIVLLFLLGTGRTPCAAGGEGRIRPNFVLVFCDNLGYGDIEPFGSTVHRTPNLSRMARVMDCSIFVKNGSSFDGLGYGGEGHCSFTIASPTGEGVTSPISFSRIRRCVLKDYFRIV